jgi:NADH dehydrogenase FAD-containing subunit
MVQITTLPRKVVVLGAGYAGLLAATRLAKKIRHENVQITLVNASDTFVERTRLLQTATNQDIKHYRIPDLLAGTRVQFVQAWVTTLHPDTNQVTIQTATGDKTLAYDHLVYALGSITDRSSIPGITEHAYTVDPKSAQELANALPAVAKSKGNVLIIGGGATGLEAVTEIAESYPDLQVSLVSREPNAAKLSPKGLKHLAKVLKRMKITAYDNTTVTRIHKDHVETTNGRKIPFVLCIFTGGFTATPLAKEAGLAVNPNGQILFDETMRSISHPNIIVIGDAGIPCQPTIAPVRMAMFTALMMGTQGSDNLAAIIKGKSPKHFGLVYVGIGVSLGRKDCIIQFLRENDQPRNWIITGRMGVIYKEFFLRYAIWGIKIQRRAPWLWYALGRRKANRNAKTVSSNTTPAKA